VSDSSAVEAIRIGLADLESGDTFSVADVRAAMVEKGRLRA
jgi:hypothetical protein